MMEMLSPGHKGSEQSKKIVSLADVDSLLDFSTARAELAYLQSLSAIIYLKEILRKDSINWNIFLDNIAEDNFETALVQNTNFDLKLRFDIKQSIKNKNIS